MEGSYIIIILFIIDDDLDEFVLYKIWVSLNGYFKKDEKMIEQTSFIFHIR